MTSLLRIASRVEAAVAAYTTVQDYADREPWKAQFMEDMKDSAREGQRISQENGDIWPPMHPTLVALSIVLDQDEDLTKINSFHPDLKLHEFFDPSAEFPSDISELLPPSADRWWEHLADAARREHASQIAPPQIAPPQIAPPQIAPQIAPPQTTPQVAPPQTTPPQTAPPQTTPPQTTPPQTTPPQTTPPQATPPQTTPPQATPPQPVPTLPHRKLKFVFRKQLPQTEEGENEDVEMAVAEGAEGSQSRGRARASKGAAATRKRKGSSTAPRGAAKRRAQSRQDPDPAIQSSGANRAGQGSEEEVLIRCDRCIEADADCDLPELGPCLRCKSSKVRCSMMPSNPETGKVDRRAYSKAQIQEFRLKKAKESRAEVKRGKRRARNSPEAGKPDDSGLAPSPSLLAPLAGLGTLTLDSGGSSAADTPADSPASLPQLPPLLERPVPTPSSAPDTRELLKAARPQPSHSHSDVSPASDDGSNATRIAALERRQDELEGRQNEVEKRLREFDSRLKKLNV